MQTAAALHMSPCSMLSEAVAAADTCKFMQPQGFNMRLQ